MCTYMNLFHPETETSSEVLGWQKVRTSIVFTIGNISCHAQELSTTRLRHYSQLKDRVLLPYTEDQGVPMCFQTASSENRPHTYRRWTEISMREGINAVSVQEMSIAKASHVYGVPQTTLSNHIVGKVLPGAKSGAPIMPSTNEKQDLVYTLLHVAKDGIP